MLGIGLKAKLEASKTEAAAQAILDKEAKVQADYAKAYEPKTVADRLVSNSLGFDLSTGASQSPFLQGAIGGPLSGTQQGNAGDLLAFVPGVGNVMNYNRAKQAKQDFLNDIEFLTSGQVLQNLIDAKAQGATFGALSEKELELLVQSANSLASMIDKDQQGNVLGLTGSPDSAQREINKLVGYYQKAVDKAATSNLSATEQLQLRSI